MNLALQTIKIAMKKKKRKNSILTQENKSQNLREDRMHIHHKHRGRIKFTKNNKVFFAKLICRLR